MLRAVLWMGLLVLTLCHASSWQSFMAKFSEDNSSAFNAGFSVITGDFHPTHISNILGSNAQLSFAFGVSDFGKSQLMIFVGENATEAEFRSNIQIDIDGVQSASVKIPSGYLTPELIFWTDGSHQEFSGVRILFPLFWNYSFHPPLPIETHQKFFSDWVAKNGQEFSFSKNSSSAPTTLKMQNGPSVVLKSLSLFQLLSTFSSNAQNTSFTMDARIQFSMEVGVAFLESMSVSGITVEYSKGSNNTWLSLDSITDQTDLKLSAYDYAIIVDKGGMYTPWLEIQGPGAASFKIIFPLFFDYTKSPPVKIPNNVQYYINWIQANGQSFYLRALDTEVTNKK